MQLWSSPSLSQLFANYPQTFSLFWEFYQICFKLITLYFFSSKLLKWFLYSHTFHCAWTIYWWKEKTVDWRARNMVCLRDRNMVYWRERNMVCWRERNMDYWRERNLVCWREIWLVEYHTFLNGKSLFWSQYWGETFAKWYF